ncbi:MAG TPA: SURF1 family protein [Steroidobacteraceae bacterium]|nr:SURF1 family protein [Steroidobacteraceae bacterium]
MTLATLVALSAFVSLGRWQWHRGEAKQAVWAEYERNAGAQALGSRRIDELPRFAHVEIDGSFAPEHQILLDNRSHQGQPGYEVLTPFLLMNGRMILVNRGWVPFTGYRDRLPDVSHVPWQSGVYLKISGRIDELPAPGLASGRAPPDAGAPWPRVTSFPTSEELSAALGERLERRVLLLDADVPGGYVREWQPPGLDPSRHFSYAIQWWGFGVVLLVLYFGLNFRKVS